MAIVYPSFNFIVMTTHTNHCLNQPHFAKVCEEQVCTSALDGLLLSLLHVFRVILISPPLTQKLFLKSVSFHLNLAQSDWEHCSARICSLLSVFLQASSLLWVSRTAVTTSCRQNWVVRRVGNLLASHSHHLGERLSKVLFPQLGVEYLRGRTYLNVSSQLRGTQPLLENFKRQLADVSVLLYSSEKSCVCVGLYGHQFWMLTSVSLERIAFAQCELYLLNFSFRSSCTL